METSDVQQTTAPEIDKLPADNDEIAEVVGRSFDRAFAHHGVNKKSVTSTFEAALDGLKKAKEPELRLRSIAKSAALSTGRCHGNVVKTARDLLDPIEDLSKKHGFDIELARDQVILGLAEAACQLGPVVYCRFLDVANTYRDEADEWIARNRRLPAIFDEVTLPVIVPYLTELTIQSAGNPPDNAEKVINFPQEPNEEDTVEAWSRPKQRNFFRRLSDAVGHWFGG